MAEGARHRETGIDERRPEKRPSCGALGGQRLAVSGNGGGGGDDRWDLLTELSQTRGRYLRRCDQHPRFCERLPRRPFIVCASCKDATRGKRVGLRGAYTTRAGSRARASPSAGPRQHLQAGGAEGGRMASGAAGATARHHGRRHWLD